MDESLCSVCREYVVGVAAIQRAGKRWHQDCFLCSHCLEPVSGSKFFEQDGKIYCEKDFGTFFGDRCYKCSQIIIGKSISAMEVKWHPEHFCCSLCEQQLVGSSFIKRQNKPYCKLCHLKLKKIDSESQLYNCGKCKKPITDAKKMVAMNGEYYHGSHFNCTHCACELEADFKIHNGKYYCLPDFKRITSTICVVCKKSIEGRSISALGQYFHPEHFTCNRCNKPVTTSHFLEYDGKAYCDYDYAVVSGTACGKCFLPHSGTPIAALNRKWCMEHFVCFGCDINMADLAMKSGKFFEWDLKPFCKYCYDKIPLDIRKRIIKYLEIEKKVIKDKEGK